VIFDGTRAVGVAFSRNGSALNTVIARKEVIISAGVIGSAQLLMLSGIGPSKHLTQLNVCCSYTKNYIHISSLIVDNDFYAYA